MNLTGAIGVRIGWFRKLIVQVQYRTTMYRDTPCVVWKDATINELATALKIAPITRHPSPGICPCHNCTPYPREEPSTSQGSE